MEGIHTTPSPRGSAPKKGGALYMILIAVAASFYSGYILGEGGVLGRFQDRRGQEERREEPRSREQASRSKEVDFDLFWDVWKRVKEEHLVKNTPDAKLFYGAVSGIVAALDDPYSVFFDPETSKKFNETLAGSFEGIGAEIGMKQKSLVIIAPLQDSPAKKAGLKAGDHILAIDKKSTDAMSVDRAVSLIRGKRGTAVTLTIFREGEKRERDVEITRETIKVASVEWKLLERGTIGYIQISHFNQDTLPRFREAVRDTLNKGARSLILDVRNNPGGFLDTAVQIAGFWVDGKTVVVERYTDEKREEFVGRSRAILKDVPTVVLVNEGSASASEIVAGALQDYDKATIVGKKSFGKGSVQDLEELRGGSSLKLTVAEWLTPKGRSINEQGIRPDIEVDSGDEQQGSKDPQLLKAIEVLAPAKKSS